MLGSFRRNVAHGYRVGFLAHDLDPRSFDVRRHTKWRRDGWTRKWFKEVDDMPGSRRPAAFIGLRAYSNAEAGASPACRRPP